MHKVSAANMLDKVEPHAKRLEDAADEMEADGIGGHLTDGHAAVLRRMSACMRADAAHGKLPSVYRDADRLYASAEPAKLHPGTVAILNALK